MRIHRLLHQAAEIPVCGSPPFATAPRTMQLCGQRGRVSGVRCARRSVLRGHELSGDVAYPGVVFLLVPHRRDWFHIVEMIDASPALRENLMDAIVAAHCTDPPAVYDMIIGDIRHRGRSVSYLESMLGSFDRRCGARVVGRLVVGHTAMAARRAAERHKNWQRRRELMLVFVRNGRGGGGGWLRCRGVDVKEWHDPADGRSASGLGVLVTII